MFALYPHKKKKRKKVLQKFYKMDLKYAAVVGGGGREKKTRGAEKMSRFGKKEGTDLQQEAEEQRHDRDD